MSDYHSSADACIAGRMQKAASAVDADTSFRAAARTSPGAVSDLQRAESEPVEDASYGPVCRLAPADS
jgi:hypothetical protein